MERERERRGRMRNEREMRRAPAVTRLSHHNIQHTPFHSHSQMPGTRVGSENVIILCDYVRTISRRRRRTHCASAGKARNQNLSSLAPSVCARGARSPFPVSAQPLSRSPVRIHSTSYMRKQLKVGCGGGGAPSVSTHAFWDRYTS